MKKNMGLSDRIIRFVIALVLGGLYFSETVTGIWGIVALVFAGIMGVTSMVSGCPIYGILGLNTTSKIKTS